ncbi:MAG: hypothetical protein FWH53_01545 [Leptospirales bacterium]|nr:hypothetical protein [Leptospirales bacterium]
MRIKITILLTILLGLIMTACSGFEEKATLTLYLGGSSKTYSASALTNWPPKDDKELGSLRYDIKLTGSKGEITKEATGSELISLIVYPGDWTIEVTAYSDNELYAHGVTSATIKTGQNNVPVLMSREGIYKLYIIVTPPEISILKGGSQAFTATPSPGLKNSDGFTGSYKWSVLGNNSNTTIDPLTGYLTVASDETAPALKVTAESLDKPSVSETVTINVVDAVNAQPPNIIVEPTSAIIDDRPTLTVVASSPDSGTLSYKWYESTTNNNSGGTEISGATDYIYTLPTTTSAGTHYYYVEVTNTNTNSNVNGNTTATTTSKVVNVTVLGGTVSIIEQGHGETDKGKVYVNTVLEIDTSTVAGAVGTPTYKWGVDWNDDGIFDELELVSTDPTYTVGSDDPDRFIKVEVTYTNGTLTATTNNKVESITGIYNLEQLEEVISGDFILLVENLNLTGKPLGYEDVFNNEISSFNGTFDGNGKTISLNINQTLKTTSPAPDNAYAGLFAIIGETGVVKNLNLTGSINVSAQADMFVGAVAGENRGNIFNVSSSVVVNATSLSGGSGSYSGSYAGGIAGLQGCDELGETGSITNCYASGNITLQSSTMLTLAPSYAGGIAGGMGGRGANSITYCWASGTITNNNPDYTAYIAGIVGYASKLADSITNCVALNDDFVHDVTGSSAQYNRIVVSGGIGGLSDNYANKDMFVNGVSWSWSTGHHMTSEGGDVYLTTGVDPTIGIASDITWWKNTTAGIGPGWDIQDTKAAANEANPWHWGLVNGNQRPILWFEY